MPSIDLEFIFKCFFEGVLFAQLIYVVLHLCVHNSRRDYLYYLLYLVSSLAYFLYKDFMFYKLDWKYGGYPYPHNGINYVLANIMHFTYLKFVKHFINTKKRYPHIHKVAYVLTRFIAFFIILNILSIVFFKTLVPVYVQYIYSGILAIVTSALIYRMFLRRNTLVNYIIFGSMMYVLSSVLSLVVAVAHVHGYLPAFESSLTILQIGVMLEVLCFTAGLAYKSVVVEKKQSLAQQRLLLQLRRNKKLDEDLQHIRDKISKDLHDDIGATLTAISVYSDVAQKYHQRQNATGVLDMLNQIGVSARQMVHDMHDIIWMINPKNDCLMVLLDKVHEFAKSVVSGKDINLHFQVGQEVHALELDMQMRRDIYLLAKESINNAVKHAHCKNLWVNLTCNNGQVELVVKDDGTGFDVSKARKGNGLYNLEKRTHYHQGKLSISSTTEGSEFNFLFALN